MTLFDPQKVIHKYGIILTALPTIPASWKNEIFDE
jgi:hypothetical protein